MPDGQNPLTLMPASPEPRVSVVQAAGLLELRTHHNSARRGDERSDDGAGTRCIPAALVRALDDVAASFGSVSVTSTCRGTQQNRAAGGAPHSYHLTGEAVDFRVTGNPAAVYAMLIQHPDVGGLKHYGGGRFHIDVGPRRSF